MTSYDVVTSVTVDAGDPARHRYAREGWAVAGPGPRDDQVISGRRRV